MMAMSVPVPDGDLSVSVLHKTGQVPADALGRTPSFCPNSLTPVLPLTTLASKSVPFVRCSAMMIFNNHATNRIPAISFAFTFSPPKSNWTVTREQFPLRLAYARTALDLHANCFAHGQLYTALSRVCHLQ
ncbi:hypothetical protein EDD15DRAFT_2283219 [Pisolithus albus]|nr:hypothetical protein EDD15DRAFT_2283219 [Pisolithus albus]